MARQKAKTTSRSTPIRFALDGDVVTLDAVDPTRTVRDLALQSEAPQNVAVMRDSVHGVEIATMDRMSFDLSDLELVRMSDLGVGNLPLVMEPVLPEVDLLAWARESAGLVETHLSRHGAIPFSGSPTQ